MKMYHTVVVEDAFKMKKKPEDIEKELEKYRSLIDKNYFDEDDR